jgi:hypothetical protein
MNIMHRLLPVALLLMAGCVAEPPKLPPPAPAPLRPPPSPVVQPVPAPAPLDWQDLPNTPGSWSYTSSAQGGEASFGASAPGFIMRCDVPTRQIQLLRPGTTTGNTMTVRTSESRRALPIAVAADASATPFVRLVAQDPLLDSMAFCRGHFISEVPGLPMLVLPAWPEPARLIEDCRG